MKSSSWRNVISSSGGLPEYELLKKHDDVLRPNMTREFDDDALIQVRDVVLSKAIRENDLKTAKLCDEVLEKYGWSKPNSASGNWEPSDVPRNEVMVREMYAHRMPEFGYEVIRSREDYPDWLLRDREGEYVYAEVEHKSSAFKSHDDTLCDLVVCWEHDYRDIRLPVLELFSETVIEPQTRAPVGDRTRVFASRMGRAWLGRSQKPDEVKKRRGYMLEVYRHHRESMGKTDAVRLTAQQTNYSVTHVFKVVKEELLS